MHFVALVYAAASLATADAPGQEVGTVEILDPRTGKPGIRLVRENGSADEFLSPAPDERQRWVKFLGIHEVRKKRKACLYMRKHFTPGFLDRFGRIWDESLYNRGKFVVLEFLPNNMVRSAVLEKGRLRNVYFKRSDLSAKYFETDDAKSGVLRGVKSDIPNVCVPDPPPKAS